MKKTMQDITKMPVDAVRRIKFSPTSELARRSSVSVMFFDINPIVKSYPFLLTNGALSSGLPIRVACDRKSSNLRTDHFRKNLVTKVPTL